MDRKTLRRKFYKNLPTIKKVFGVLLAVIAIVLAVTYLSRCDSGSVSTESADDGQAKIQVDGQWYELRDDVEAVLAIGIDKYEEDVDTSEGRDLNTQQCDFLALLIIDYTNKSYNILHINRDTMTDVQEIGLNYELIGTNYEQICLAHTYGTGGKDSCSNTTTAVSHLLYSVPVDRYVAFTMDVVPMVNDAAGGVTVHIEDDFSGTEPAFVQGTDVTLQGEQALTFVRARSSMVDDATNIARMKRQRTYVTALREAAIKKMEEDENWAATTLLEIADYLTTNINQSDLAIYADVMTTYKQSEILQIEGEAITNEYVEFYPDEEALQQQVLDLFYTPVEG